MSELAADYRSGAGEQREVALGEDATVQMNTRTRINVSAQARGERVDLLAGEVELRAGARPVSLSAGAGSVTVRDACVNVRYTDAQVRVTCLEGGGCGGRAASWRWPRHGAAGRGRPARARDADLAAISGWRRGVLEFNDVPLAQVVDEINRYRAGRILLMGDRLAGSRVQARFPLDQLADAALLIRDVYGARVTTLPGGIVLLS